MLYDIVIRLFEFLGFLILINANGITTVTVVMSLCMFFILEVSILFKNKKLSLILTLIPFLITFTFIIYSKNNVLLRSFSCIYVLCFTLISLYLYEKVCLFKKRFHKTYDESKEQESILKEKNKKLLSSQDEQVHLATLAERNRIAREIHDNVGHLLSRSILLLGAITTVNSDEKINPQLKMLSDTLDESMKKMRESVHDLYDDSIDLEKNINEIINELNGFTILSEIDCDESIPKNVKLALIGILKEAVNNILKHSNGDCVKIILHQNYSFCSLSVYDNGTLTSEEKDKISLENCNGIGLNNIRQRARQLGGDAYFYTNNGFTVFARLPFQL